MNTTQEWQLLNDRALFLTEQSTFELHFRGGGGASDSFSILFFLGECTMVTAELFLKRIYLFRDPTPFSYKLLQNKNKTYFTFFLFYI